MRILIVCLSLLVAVACTPALAHAGDEGLPPASKPGAVLLLVATTPDGTVATFGQSGGDGGAAGAALARAVEALGFTLKSAAGQPVAVTTEGGGNSLVPVGDQSALEVARKAGAGAAFVVGVHVKADGGIRGTRLLGAAGRGQLRLLDVQSGAAVASADLEGAGFDAALDRAAAAAGRDIAERLVRAIEGPATARWPVSAPASSGAFVTVDVRGARAWSSVAAIIQKLGATEGVSAVHARDVRRGHIALAVETRLAARNLAAAVERARLPSGTVRATARGDSQVQVEIRGDSASPSAPGEQP
ncbi:MAG TPA: hypothetical protein VIG06_09180 [Kofleriaceae bacterium]